MPPATAADAYWDRRVKAGIWATVFLLGTPAICYFFGDLYVNNRDGFWDVITAMGIIAAIPVVLVILCALVWFLGGLFVGKKPEVESKPGLR